MKVAVISFLLAVTAVSTWSVSALNLSFKPKTSTTTMTTTTTSTQLDSPSYSRRDAIKQTFIGVSAAAVFVSGADNNSIVANAFSQQLDDYAYEPQQQATGGKWDLNSVFVGDYKAMPGMYPHAAGKIASNGPWYQTVGRTRPPLPPQWLPQYSARKRLR